MPNKSNENQVNCDPFASAAISRICDAYLMLVSIYPNQMKQIPIFCLNADPHYL